MKRVLGWIFGLFVLLVILAAFRYLYSKSQTKVTVFETESAEIADITKKTVATGSIVPRQSVDVKPKVTGVISELYFKDPGALVKKDAPLAKIQIIPDAQGVNNAASQVTSAKITLDNAKRELDREEGLFKTGVVAESELYKFRTDYALAQSQLELASSNLQIVKEGARGGAKGSTLIVTATVDGTIIDVPVKVGYSVIQANSFNPGTTVMTIANMDDMIFDGHVDEAEVAKISMGPTAGSGDGSGAGSAVKLAIKVGAIEKDIFEGKLEFIAPQGKEIDGAIQFEIKAAVVQKPGVYIRAGYSANADIVLDERKQVLSVREAVVQYDDKKNPYIEVETAPQVFVRKDIKTGLSDGIRIEVLSGVDKADKIKIPDNAGPAGMGSGSGSGGGGGMKPPPKPPSGK